MVLGLFRSEIWISRPRVNYDTDLNLNRTRQLGGGMYSAEYVTKLTCCLITTQYRKLHKPTESTGCGVTRKTAKMGNVSGRTGGHNHVLARGRQPEDGNGRKRAKGWKSFGNAGEWAPDNGSSSGNKKREKGFLLGFCLNEWSLVFLLSGVNGRLCCLFNEWSSMWRLHDGHNTDSLACRRWEVSIYICSYPLILKNFFV